MSRSSATIDKRDALLAIAAAIEAAAPEIVAANAEDLERGRATRSLGGACRIGCASTGPASAPSPTPCATIAALPDPVGRVLDERTLPNGVQLDQGLGAVRRRRVDLRSQTRT